ncbi:MAG TPA: LCP family protein [Actinomycetes bacterium]|nr:LCP family protein [Actinomycetes bacterium]
MPVTARHARPRAPRRRRRVIVALLSVAVLVAGTVGGALLWANWQLSQVPTFSARPPVVHDGAAPPTEAVEEPLRLPAAMDGVSTFLVFSTGSRDMSAEDARRYGVPDLAYRGDDSLTDSIILAVLDAPARQLSMLSIPRDTWIERRGTRINEVFLNHGAAALAQDVTRLTGLPVNHMVAVSFTAAARLTDVVGGIDLQIPTPMRDRKSHLLLPDSGCIHMDGRTALAFARSRHTQTMDVDGSWRGDPSASDFGRSTRQQAVITAALGKLLSPRLPLYLPDLAATARATLTIDAGLDMGALFDTGRVLATGDALAVHHFGLPSRVGKVGEASVVFTDAVAARRVLAPLIAAVPTAEWPRWLGPEPRSSSPTPTPTDTAVEDRSSTTVVGSDTQLAVEGFDTGPNTGYRTCSDGLTPPAQPTSQNDPRFFRSSR